MTMLLHTSSSFMFFFTLFVMSTTSTPTAAAAFLHDMFPLPQQQQPLVRPDLKKLTDHQADTELNIRFTVTNPEEDDQPWASQLSVSGLKLELHHDRIVIPSSKTTTTGMMMKSKSKSNSNKIINHQQSRTTETTAGKAVVGGGGGPMPGANGPHPQLSSGSRQLEVLQSGHYVNLLGTQTVQMLNGCWELCWMKDKPAGNLICGFDIPKSYHRNAAYVPQGRLYLSFPVWSPQGLAHGQAQRTWAEGECAKMLQRRDHALHQFDCTNNPLMKAYHLYQAFHAIEHYNDMPHDTIERIPNGTTNKSVIPLSNTAGNLLLSQEGVVYAKSESLQTKLGIPQEDFVFLGKAHVMTLDKSNSKTLRP